MPISNFCSVALLSLALVAAVAVSAHADIAGTYSADTTITTNDTWTGGNLTIDAGFTLDIDLGVTVTYDSASQRSLLGDGEFLINAGAFFIQDTSTSDDNIFADAGGTFTNNGTHEFSSGGDFRLNSSSYSYVNNGLILKSQGSQSSSNDPSYIFGATSTTGGSFLNTGTIQVTTGHLNIARGASTGGTFDVDGGILSFSGRWTELTATSDVSGGLLTIGNEDPAGTTGGDFIADAATTVINVIGDGIDWRATTGSTVVDINTNGNVVDNQGIMHIRSTDDTRGVIGSGTLKNTGTLNFAQGTLSVGSGSIFSNEGTLEIISGGTKTFTGAGTIENAATGTVNFNDGTTSTFNSEFVNKGIANLVGGSVGLDGTSGFTNNAGATLNLKSSVALTINSSTLVNDGSATFAESGNKTITGDSAFINNGSFVHSHTSGSDNLQLGGTGGFTNNGTFEFTTDGDIDISGAGHTFTNAGLFRKSGSGGDPTFVFRNGSFVNDAGGEVRSDAGVIVIALNNSTSDAGAIWNANTGEIQIGGSWSGTFNGSGGDDLFVGTHGNGTVGKQVLTVNSGGIVMNMTGAGGFELRSQSINTAAGAFTNTGLFQFTGTVAKSISGGGTFQNTGAGQMELISTVLTLNATDLTNAAGFTIAGTVSLDGSGELINASGGTMTWDTPTTASVFTLDTVVRNHATFNITGDQVHTLEGAGSIVNESGGTMSWNTTAGASTLDIDSLLSNSGTFNFTGVNTHTLDGLGSLTNASGGTMNWSDGTLSLTSDLTNDGTFNFVAGNESLAGSGTFINNGTFNHNAPSDSADNISGASSGEFVNNGLFDFKKVGDFELTDNYVFTNAANGIVRKSGAGANEALFFHFGGGAGTGGTFDNQGTVEVLAGQLEIRAADGSGFDDIVVPQVVGTSLVGGTWIVDASADGSAILDLQAGNPGLTTIGAGAIVKLIAAGSVFNQVNGVTTVNGEFYVNGTRSYTLTGGFTVGASGTLGGDGTYVGDADIAGTLAPGDIDAAGILTFMSTVDLTGGTFSVDIDGLTVGTEYDQLAFTGAGPHTLILAGTLLALDVTYLTTVGDTFVIVDGFDTLTGTFVGLADGTTFKADGQRFTINYNLDNITLTAAEVPEPTTALLLAGVGLVAATRRRRRSE